MNFKKLAGIGLLALGVAALSNASDKGDAFTIRVGTVLPTSGDGADVGKTWTALGADLRLSPFAVNSNDNNGFYSVSLDYYIKNDWRSIPLTVNYNVTEGLITYFLGAGVTSTKYDFGNERIVLTAVAGASLDLGVFRGHPVNFSAKVFLPTRHEFAGVGFYLGTKF